MKGSSEFGRTHRKDMRKIIIILLLLTIGSVAVGAGIVLNLFTGGELSPLMEGRSDIAPYYGGLRELTNMVMVPQGPVIKRPGTYYISDANVVTAVRLIPFEYSTTESYVVEVGKEYMRFYLEE